MRRGTQPSHEAYRRLVDENAGQIASLALVIVQLEIELEAAEAKIKELKEQEDGEIHDPAG